MTEHKHICLSDHKCSAKESCSLAMHPQNGECMFNCNHSAEGSLCVAFPQQTKKYAFPQQTKIHAQAHARAAHPVISAISVDMFGNVVNKSPRRAADTKSESEFKDKEAPHRYLHHSHLTDCKKRQCALFA